MRDLVHTDPPDDWDLAGPAPDPPGTTYRRGRTPRAVREAQMVAAAERLFSERGYHGVSMDEIAAASGISKPMLYEYFGSKEGLLLACVERARGRLFEEIAAAVRQADQPERALRAGVEAFLSFADAQRATWVVLFGEGGRFGETAGAIRAEQSGLIAQLLRELPGWAAEPDAEQLDAIAHVFVGAAEAVAFWAVDHPEVPLERVADHLMAVLWPVVRDLPSRASAATANQGGKSSSTVSR
jgi:AcrR family transcriptional regulator